MCALLSLHAELLISGWVLERVIDSIEFGGPVILVIDSLDVVSRSCAACLIKEAVELCVILFLYPKSGFHNLITSHSRLHSLFAFSERHEEVVTEHWRNGISVI